MKIVIQQLESIEGVEIFTIIALLIFFVFFSAMLVYVLKLDKQTVKANGKIPLEDDNSTVSGL
ncbi:MAG: CcoQ/FixQ family Cbb3-type cytochrome c oxidase assembly chaperone [Bacteroidetes bacterium]|nr:MAG: CcoQ/FixQ family Cbb3-type cytochrome c oxidase assembly chaperone [Bacteroidota bacterium]